MPYTADLHRVVPRRYVSTLTRAAIAAFAVAALGCGSDSNSPVPVETVEVTGPATDVAIGSTLQLSATAKDANGNVLANRTFAWTSSSNAIATVSNSGLVQGVAAGTATIRAEAGGKSATMQIGVHPPVTVPTVVTLPASNVTSSSVRLNGTVNPNGGATDFTFEYGQTSALGSSCPGAQSIPPGSMVSVWCDLTQQPAGRTIFYRVVAQNSAGRVNGATLNVTTSSASGSPPVITSVNAPSTGSTSAGARTVVTVGYSDPDGDITKVVSTSNNPNVVNNGTVDLASLAGRTSGTFQLTYTCTPAAGATACNAGTATVSLVLEDAKGNRSAPAQFTITIQ